VLFGVAQATGRLGRPARERDLAGAVVRPQRWIITQPPELVQPPRVYRSHRTPRPQGASSYVYSLARRGVEFLSWRGIDTEGMEYVDPQNRR